VVICTLPPGGADQLAGRVGRPGQTLLDVVYEPWPTVLAAAARAAGATVVSGASMLLHQAAAQVQLMTGQPAPVAAMRAALRAAAPASGV
jgi:shikimate dehydrogenase